MPVNEGKVNEFMGRFMCDFGAVAHAPLIILGEELGLYKALAASGPCHARDLAQKTDTDERHVLEWLSANAASGYVEYDPATGKFSMTPEQAFTLADEDSPAYVPSAFVQAMALFLDQPKIVESFRTGEGVAWHEHSHQLFHGLERFFRANYLMGLVPEWIPALDGVEAKLQAGAKVADVGCGHAAPVILMAQAFPRSRFAGFDNHPASIEVARERAKDAGVAERCSFEAVSAKEFPGSGYDLITMFDCLHDMGDPVGASRHVLDSLGPDGVFMIVEPFADDRLENNLTPLGRVSYSMSTQICTPMSKSQEVGLALGAQAGEARLREVVLAGGFKHFRRAAETPFNMIFEARP